MAERRLLSRLYLRDFRSYPRLELAFAPGLNAFVGPNGAGKTNLLEAIHYLCLGSSFRAARDAEAVAWGADGFFVKGRLRDEAGELDVEVAFRPGHGKVVRVGGRSLGSTAELYGTLPCVSFRPEDLEWAKGPPAARRLWLDRLLVQTSASYRAELLAFREALAERNALLVRNRHEKATRALLVAWREAYLERAAALAAERARALAEIGRRAAEELGALTGESLALAVVSGGEAVVPAAGEASAWRERYAAQLEAVAEEELVRGHTLAGPHRDDILALLDGRDARRYASQGQQRSLVAALKLAEVGHIEARLGRLPCLLLDDVFSELDGSRRARLGEAAMTRAQTFLTAADDRLLPEVAGARVFDVRPGAAQARDG